MVTKFFINNLPFKAQAPLDIPKSLQPGETLEIKLIGDPPLSKGRIKIIDENQGNVFIGLVKMLTTETKSSGQHLYSYHCTDLAPTLEYKDFSVELDGQFSEMLELMKTRARISLPTIFNCSNSAKAAQVKLDIKDQFFKDALPKLLAKTGFKLQYNVTANGQLEIYQVGFGGLAPFEYVLEDQNGRVKTANMKIVGRPKLTEKIPEAWKIKVYGLGSDLRIGNGTSGSNSFIKSIGAIKGQNNYPLTGGADLVGVFLLTETKHGDPTMTLNVKAVNLSSGLELTLASPYIGQSTDSQLEFGLLVTSDHPVFSTPYDYYPDIIGSAMGIAALTVVPTGDNIPGYVVNNPDPHQQTMVILPTAGGFFNAGDYPIMVSININISGMNFQANTMFILRILPPTGGGGGS